MMHLLELQFIDMVVIILQLKKNNLLPYYAGAFKHKAIS